MISYKTGIILILSVPCFTSTSSLVLCMLGSQKNYYSRLHSLKVFSDNKNEEVKKFLYFTTFDDLYS